MEWINSPPWGIHEEMGDNASSVASFNLDVFGVGLC